MKQLPKLPVHQLVWIFDTAREHYAEKVRALQSDIIRLEKFGRKAASAEKSWMDRSRTTIELSVEKQVSIDKLLPVIEFCDRAREMFSDASNQQFAEAFKGYLASKKKG